MDLVGRQGLGQRVGGRVHHVVCHTGRLGKNGTQSEAGEHVHVVALVGVVCDGTRVVAHLDSDGREGGARGEDDSSLSPVDGLLKGALGLGEGVAEGEEDGTAVGTTSVDGGLEGPDGGLGEAAKSGRQADQGAGLDILNDLFQGAELLAIVVGAGKVLLVLSQVITTVLGDETLCVYEPELVAGLLLRESPTSVVLHELLGNTHTGGASTHEDEALLLKRNAREIHSTNITDNVLDRPATSHEKGERNIPSENDSTGTLDIIVKAPVGVLIAVKILECLLGLEILKLDDHVGVDILDGFHELIHELLLVGCVHTLMAQTEVQRVLEIGLVVGTTVQDNGEGLLGVDAGGSGIQRELANLEELLSGLAFEDQ